MAIKNGITTYSGTAAQNNQMLALLKAGNLKRPDGSASTATTSNSSAYYPKCSSSCTTITAGLNSIGVDSSYANRKQIAIKNGITTYSGTAAQNNQMLAWLKAGTLKRI